MSVTVKNGKRLGEVEYCITNYFCTHFAPIMNAVKKELQEAQAKEIGDYATSFSGIMRSLSAASNPYAVDDTLTYLQITGDACSKTAEDYVGMVKDRIVNNEDYQADLSRLAAEWREAIVVEVGRDRYNEVSAQLGTDLALAYVDYRVEQMIIDKMVRDQMPKSDAEYIIRKGASDCLLGLPQSMLKSPLQEEIDSRGEAAFSPSTATRWGARGVSLASDIVATGGVGSWGALARIAGLEVVLAGMESYLDKKAQGQKGLTVEQCISNALWGTTTNVFPAIRKDTWKIKTYENDYIKGVNAAMSKKMGIATEKPVWEIDWDKPFEPITTYGGFTFTPWSLMTAEADDRSDIPMPIMPGKEDEYRKWRDQQAIAALDNPFAPSLVSQQDPDFIGPPKPQSMDQNDNVQNTDNTEQGQMQEQANGTQSEPEDNGFSWSSLLQTFGLDGMGDIGKNLPYVIAMLPDMLVGLMTGKTKSVSLKGEMIPMASILLGMFVKNPLLKLVLIGMGGANLLNKMGHEAIDRMEPKTQFRQYPDEPLNPRITNPVIQGSVMVATIDNIPCSITLPANAAQAYAVGALPINTLANAILAKHDEAQTLAQDNYRNVQLNNPVERDRGMALK